MKELNADIVIFGSGIAGLWTFHHLKKMGYNVLMLEADTIGNGQSVASQGIIHSGLKYVFGGKINELAKSISAMPDRWREALRGEGSVDLRSAQHMASSQYLLIPPGLMRGLLELVTTRALGNKVKKIGRNDWPEGIVASGFDGTAIFMDEPVLDATTVVRALAEPFMDSIRKINWPGGVQFQQDDQGAITEIILDQTTIIRPKQVVFTAAASNLQIARLLKHDDGLETQHRPLLMGMMRNAPYALHAHCVGPQEKPIITITTHKDKDGSLVWYLGGSVAEREKEADPNEVYEATRKVVKKYLPDTDFSNVEWATLPIDRVEGKRSNHKQLPDSPVIHTAANALYGWPTKLTFAPFLSDMVYQHLQDTGIEPSNQKSDWSCLPQADITDEPWNKEQITWTSEKSLQDGNSDQQASN